MSPSIIQLGDLSDCQPCHQRMPRKTPHGTLRPVRGFKGILKAPCNGLIHHVPKVATGGCSSTDIGLCSKRPGEFLDPCQEAASRSLKCLHRNGGDRDMCTDYFQYVAGFNSSLGHPLRSSSLGLLIPESYSNLTITAHH